LTVECDGSGNFNDLQNWLGNNGGATVVEDCGNVTWSNDYSALSDDCGASGSVQVVFTATDDCGNSESTSGVFIISDTTNPTITTQTADLTIECDGNGNQAEIDAWLNANGGAVASDICGAVA